jgi:hypothetical protein
MKKLMKKETKRTCKKGGKMKKGLFATFMVCTCFLGIVIPVLAKDNQSSPSTTPFRFSFWPNVFSWPSEDVCGLSIGLPGAYGKSDSKVVGADLGVFISESPGVEGLQMAAISVGKDSTGAQLGIANAVDNFGGMQAGIFNAAVNNSSFFQLGLINHSRKSSGFQIGFLNFMDNGLFSVFLLFNYSDAK